MVLCLDDARFEWGHYLLRTLALTLVLNQLEETELKIWIDKGQASGRLLSGESCRSEL